MSMKMDELQYFKNKTVPALTRELDRSSIVEIAIDNSATDNDLPVEQSKSLHMISGLLTSSITALG